MARNRQKHTTAAGSRAPQRRSDANKAPGRPRVRPVLAAVIAAGLLGAASPLALAQDSDQGGTGSGAAASSTSKGGLFSYVPPVKGAPAARVGGASRGGEGTQPVVEVLVPDHVGLALSATPTLYWFLSGPSPHPLEISLLADDADEPALRLTRPGPQKAGIHALSLARQGQRLEAGKTYDWVVALVADPDQRSLDIVAHGAVQRVARPPEGLGALEGLGPRERAARLAGAGLWYDALEALSQAVDQGTASRAERGQFLAQVGLSEAATHEQAGR